MGRALEAGSWAWWASGIIIIEKKSLLVVLRSGSTSTSTTSSNASAADIMPRAKSLRTPGPRLYINLSSLVPSFAHRLHT
jgi:hypothetical protein